MCLPIYHIRISYSAGNDIFFIAFLFLHAEQFSSWLFVRKRSVQPWYNFPVIGG